MKRYRRKPEIIEAMQWTGDNALEVIDFMGHLPMLEKGDYIFKGPQGELCVDGKSYFEQIYEPVAEESERERILRETCPICGSLAFINSEADKIAKKNKAYAAKFEYPTECRVILSNAGLLKEYGVSGSVPTLETPIEHSDGSHAYFYHDKCLLEDSKIIWKLDGSGVLATNDGGTTWVKHGHLNYTDGTIEY